MSLLTPQTWHRLGQIGFVAGFTLILGSSLINGFMPGFNTLEDRVIYFNISGSVFCILLLLAMRKSLVTMTFVDFAFLIFIAFISINSFLTVGLFNNFQAAIVISVFVYFSARMFLLEHAEKISLIENISLLFLLISFAELGFAVFQFFHLVLKHDTNYELRGTFNNSGIFSIYIGSSFIYFLAIYLFTEKASKKKLLIRNLSGIYLLLVILILPSAQSRTANLTAVIMSLLLLNYKYKPFLKLSRRLKYVSLGFLLVAATILSFKLYYYKQASADGRVTIWRGALLAVNQHPWTGIGFNQFQNKFPDYQAIYFKDHPAEAMTFADKNDYVFNDYLQLLVENGIPGLALFIVILIAIIRNWYKHQEMSVYLVASAAGGVFVIGSGFTSYPFQIISIWFNLIFFSLVISVLIIDKYSITLHKYAKALLFSACIIICIGILTMQWRALNAKSAIVEARSSADDEDYDDAIKFYQYALNNFPSEKAVYLELGKCYLLAEMPQKCIQTLNKATPFIADPFLSSNLAQAYEIQGDFRKGEQFYLASINMMPNRMYPRYLLFKMYLTSGQYEKARKTGNFIMSMPIKINSTAISEMKTEVANLLKSKLPQ